MTTHYQITLTLPDTEPRQIGWVEAESDEALIARLSQRYPLLPPHHTLVGDRPLAGLLAQPAATPEPVPAPADGLTEGQRLWRERKKRRAYAERHRAHWASKDDK